MVRLSHQYPWARSIMLLPRYAISQKYKNENVNTARSLEADRIEQVQIFILFSHTEAIESVTFV